MAYEMREGSFQISSESNQLAGPEKKNVYKKIVRKFENIHIYITTIHVFHRQKYENKLKHTILSEKRT